MNRYLVPSLNTNIVETVHYSGDSFRIFLCLDVYKFTYFLDVVKLSFYLDFSKEILLMLKDLPLQSSRYPSSSRMYRTLPDNVVDNTKISPLYKANESSISPFFASYNVFAHSA